MQQDAEFWISLGAFALVFLVFSDAARLTLGQRYQVQRSRERFLLFLVELALVSLWLIGRFRLGWDGPLLPARADGRPAWGAAAGVVGLALVLGGCGLMIWAKLALGRMFSGTFGIKPGHRLVTGGPYRVTRHPMYTGMVSAALGSALVWDSRLTLALAVALAVPLFLHTRVEERLFEEHFGDEWRDYRARVPRMVPFTRWGGR